MEEVHQAGVRCSFGQWQPGAALSDHSPCLFCCRKVEAASSPWCSQKNGFAGERRAAAAALQWPQPRKDREMYLGRFSLWKSLYFSSLNYWGQEVAVNWVTGKETQLAACRFSGAPAWRSCWCSSQQKPPGWCSSSQSMQAFTLLQSCSPALPWTAEKKYLKEGFSSIWLNFPCHRSSDLCESDSSCSPEFSLQACSKS